VAAKNALTNAKARWIRDPSLFFNEVVRNPRTGKPFTLFEAERIFLKHAFIPLPDGSLPYEDILWSCIKKSGKSTFGAMCLLYTVLVLGGNYAEAYVISNDLLQARDRIFTNACRIIEKSPLLKANIIKNRIEFTNGSFIEALAADYRGAAGSEPVMVIADEVWGFTTEAAMRLFEECCPTPTRKPTVRMVTSYAGYSGESIILERLVNRALTGKVIGKDLYAQPGLIAFVSHERIAPWQTVAWFEQQRRSKRPTDFTRQMLNHFAAGESEFVSPEQWDACVDPTAHPILTNRNLPVWVGLDASVKRDSTAIVCTTWDDESKRVHLVWHKIFQPSPDRPLDFEATIETTLLELAERFSIQAVSYDPWQLVAVSERLRHAGLPMEECPQTPPRQTEFTNNLEELIRSNSLVVYPDAAMRLAMSRAVVVENPRGKRIAKEKASHKIDVVVALAMSALGAVRGGQTAEPGIIGYYRQLAQGQFVEDTSSQPPTPAELLQQEEQEEEPVGEENELWKAYQDALGESHQACDYCGKKMGPAKTTMGQWSFHQTCPAIPRKRHAA
jgi:hypothetical protein